jgi:ATP-dependent protease ClpP protease subunit
MPRYWFCLACCLALGACGGPSTGDAAPSAAADAMASVEPNGTGAFISAPAEAPPPVFDIRRETDWPPAQVADGRASISCELDYAEHGDGEPLVNLEFFSVVDALTPCQERGVMRLRYHGNITADFTALVERVSEIAKRMDIDKRVLDIDSLGGQVEDAIRAGDAIGASGWTIWVREGASCHSACVLILGAGDVRMISGRVGIHRIIRMSSTATSRAQLNTELQAVYGRVKDYLERNGVAVAVGDLMMAVPNRNLRLLTGAELQEYGLDGTNPAQDDLDRLQLMRKCGEDFVLRRDSFARAFDRECKASDKDVDELNACGLGLRPRFGFPDETCPDDSPMSEFDPIRSAFFDRKQEVVPNADARKPAKADVRG